MSSIKNLDETEMGQLIERGGKVKRQYFSTVIPARCGDLF
jgi:hypothetical protein